MKVYRDELLNAIKTVQPATSNIEDMSNLYFSGEDIVAYNDKICFHAPFKSDFVFLINGSLMFNFVSRVDSEQITMALKDGKLIMKAKGMKATLTTVLTSEIIDRTKRVKEELENLRTYELPKDFVEGAFLCMFSASKEPATGTLTCLNVEGNELITGDKRRVSLYTLKEKMESFMIEASIASELKRLEEITLSVYGISDSWIHFITDTGTTLSVRRILGEFPDYHEIIKSVKGIKIKLPEGIRETIETASLTVEGSGSADIHRVLIELSKNSLKCLGTSETKGTIEKTSKVSYDGKDVSFSISPTFLLEVLNKAATVIIDSENHKALFRSGSFKHVMTLPITQKGV